MAVPQILPHRVVGRSRPGAARAHRSTGRAPARAAGGLERAPTLARFLTDPIGRCVATGHGVLWCAAPGVLGVAAWDEPSPADVDFLTAGWDALAAGGVGSLDEVIDLRFVHRIRDDAFATLVEWHRGRPRAPHPVRRQVLLVPVAFASAVVHGFWSAAAAPGHAPWYIAGDDAEGFAWLGRASLRGDVASMLDALRTPGPLERLRHWLELHLADGVDLDAAAAALATSTRSLQRQLRDAGTSFRDEVRAARLAVARRLLTAPGAKIEAVTAAVGCKSASSFVRLFHEVHGETPAAWRDRRRGAR